MKKLIGLALLALFPLGLAACGDDKGSDQPKQDQQQTQQAQPAQ